MGRGISKAAEVEDGIVWADSGPWLWARIPTLHYDGLTVDQAQFEHQRLVRVLCAPEVGECHLRIVERPEDVDGWAAGISTYGPPSEAWTSYLAGHAGRVQARRYTHRCVYIGVRLATVGQGSVLKALGAAFAAIGANALRSKDETDRNGWRDRADSVLAAMAGHGLPVVAASADELRWLIARPFWLDINPVSTTPTGVMEKHWHNTRLVQPTGELWVAVATIKATRFGMFPGHEFLRPLPELTVQPDISIRYQLVAADEQARAFERARTRVDDEAINLDPTGAEVPSEMGDRQTRLTELATAARHGRTPYVWWHLAVTMTAPDRDRLAARFDEVARAYARVGVSLMVPEADQRQLLLELRPGERWRCRDWQQVMPARDFVAGMPHTTTSLGDRSGTRLGDAMWMATRAVRIDPLTVASGTDDDPDGLASRTPTMAFTGEPGMGKSKAMKKLAHDCSLRGATIVHADPARETGALTALPGIVEKAQIIQLSGDEYGGTLGAWNIHGHDPAATTLAVDLAKMMLPHGISVDQELAMTSIADRVHKAQNPSMARFFAALAEDPTTGEMGRGLQSLARMQLGQLFAGDSAHQIDIADRYTVLRWDGIRLPHHALPADQWKVEHRLSLAVLHASAALIARLMGTTRTAGPKIAIYDEAHQFTRSEAGAALVMDQALGGRKLDSHVWLVSQLAASLEAVRPVISVALAFRAGDAGEAGAVCRLLRRGSERETEAGMQWIPDQEIADRLMRLPVGSCMMRDRRNRVGTVRVLVDDPALFAATETTPQGAAAGG